MFDLIIGYFFVLLAVATFLTGLITAIKRHDCDCSGYCALGIFPLIVSIFFLTTCQNGGAVSWSRIYEQQKATNEIEKSRLELEKMKVSAAIPVEPK